jgi:spore cortex formation protein SpoVR/YcgB (stage V sporulation)
MTETKKQDYKESVFSLLDKYVEGRDLFKNAHNAKSWDYPVEIKEEFKNDPHLPDSWLELVEKVFSIIAKEKYNLDTYDNRIEIITSNQMLDAYTSIGLPMSYEHWSFGKRRIMEEHKFESGGGLAFEIVINSAPSLAYCMEGNSPLMQMLVIAHACFGHNNFFKENFLFKDHTNPHTIFDRSARLRNLIRSCEEEHGYEEVEKVIDASHALKLHAVDRNPYKKTKTPEERQAAARQALVERFEEKPRSEIYDTVMPKKDFQEVNDNKKTAGVVDLGMEENILTFIANNAPHLPEWKREIMRGIAEIQQYFHPQGYTQVMNEGWASFWHYTLIHDMEELGLMNNGMMFEFYDSHAGVLFQPDFDETRPVIGPDGRPVIDPNTGQPQRRNIYNGINPYTLGFNMFNDIKRICMEPTEEDKEFFPDIAGNGEWLETIKFARDNFKDESFIQQYLSPKLAREFAFFTFEDDFDDTHITIGAIHNKKGFRDLRDNLSSQYKRSDMIPRIVLSEYHHKTDRRLILKHIMQDDKPLEEKNTLKVLRHMYSLWEHPVVLKSVNPDGGVENTLSIPPRATKEPEREKSRIIRP